MKNPIPKIRFACGSRTMTRRRRRGFMRRFFRTARWRACIGRRRIISRRR